VGLFAVHLAMHTSLFGFLLQDGLSRVPALKAE
jgi:hypothetical protein